MYLALYLSLYWNFCARRRVCDYFLSQPLMWRTINIKNYNTRLIEILLIFHGNLTQFFLFVPKMSIGVLATIINNMSFFLSFLTLLTIISFSVKHPFSYLLFLFTRSGSTWNNWYHFIHKLIIGRWFRLVSNQHLRNPVIFSDTSVSAVHLSTPEAAGDVKFEIELGELKKKKISCFDWLKIHLMPLLIL